MSVFKAGEKPREQLRLPQASYIQADQWMDYLGYEQYCWWMKFHTWVDRRPTKLYENHIPYTLESVFDKLGVSQTTFYRKIKVLWECGLIEIIEFEASERKSQKPKNIIVYDYPFNNAEKEYRPLEKLRDWKMDYDSQSKLAGIKGAFLKKMASNEAIEGHPPKSERVEKPVDKYPPKTERVDPPKFERVTLPELGGINSFNNLLTKTNKSNNYANNSLILSLEKVKIINEILTAMDYTERERSKIIEFINERGLGDVSRQDIIKQARLMASNPDIKARAIYFVNGLEMNIGRSSTNKGVKEDAKKPTIPIYNWLEN